LALGAAIACVIALLLATLGVAAGAAVGGLGARQVSPATTDRAYEGMITCSRCGARHSATLGQTADVCVRVCVHGGANFALVNAASTYLLEGDLNALKKLAGQRARVVGSLSGKTIRVASAAPQS
jgi:hypothetical protein